MKWSRISYFIFAVFPFLFMEAMGNIPESDPVVRSAPGMEEYALCQEDSLITEEKSTPGRTSGENSQSVRGKGNVSLLSFNFIYYIIYKFMYVEDIFRLNQRPSNAPN